MRRILRGLAASLLLAAPLGLRADETGPAFPSAAKVTLGAAHAVTEPVSLSFGHAELKFTGTWAPLLRGDQTVGLFLNGQGTVTYTSVFEPEAVVFARNMKEWTSVQTEKSGKAIVATVPFSTARLFLAGTTPPLLPGAAGTLPDAVYQDHLSWWSRVGGYTPDHLLDVQALNAPARPAAVLEFEKDSDHWLYALDGADTLWEQLKYTQPYKFTSSDLKGWSYAIGMSRQPVGWDPRKGLAPTRFQLNALDVDLRTKDNRNATMVVQETLTPFEEGLQVLPFGLWNTLELEKGTRNLRVSRITDGDGHALAFHHAFDRILVRLATPSKRGVPIVLKFEYEGDFLIQPEEDNYWQLGVREDWYPTPASYASESYTFHGTVRTTGDWIAFLPGDTVRREKEGAWNVVETRTSHPITFATILGGKYFMDEESHDGLTLRIATYGFKPGGAAKVFKAQFFNVVHYYEGFLGPFPFKEFTVVEKNQWGYGQAPPGMMYITLEAFNQVKEAAMLQELNQAIDQARRQGAIITGQQPTTTTDVRHVFAHELAHQYWGIQVKMPSAEDQWVTESFADYCAGLFERDYKGKALFERDLSRWEDKARQATMKAPIPLANDIHEKDGAARFYTRVGLLYNKGPLLLHYLHQQVGEQAFLTWMKSVQSNFRWKFVNTWQLFDILKFISKKDFTPIYQYCYWDLEMPPKAP